VHLKLTAETVFEWTEVQPKTVHPDGTVELEDLWFKSIENQSGYIKKLYVPKYSVLILLKLTQPDFEYFTHLIRSYYDLPSFI
jgi:hypothetical protein